MYLHLLMLYFAMATSIPSAEWTEKYYSDANFYPFLSSKTSYEFVRGEIKRQNLSK
jgi:hypothetical protein